MNVIDIKEMRDKKLLALAYDHTSVYADIINLQNKLKAIEKSIDDLINSNVSASKM